MANCKSPFQYQPLIEIDSIRLLHLEPAFDPESELRGSFIHTTITECSYDLLTPFTALSYCWGGNVETCRLHLDDCQSLPITRTLDAALRDMRHTSIPRRVWADAVCINQASDQERGHQVSIMHQIYRTANHTIIHLGLSDQAVHHFFATHGRCSPSARLDSVEVPELSEIQQAVFAAPWFTRVWVFQELVLSRDPWVQCGLHRMRWADFCRVLGWEAVAGAMRLRLSESLDSQKGSTNPFQRMSERTEEKFSAPLHAILEARRGAGATDPRDLVFANFGIASDRHIFDKYIALDYTRSVGDVFNDVAHYIAEACGLERLFVLTLDFERGFSGPGIAPWAPDWTCDKRRRTRRFHGFQRAVIHRLRGCKWLHVDFTPTGGVAHFKMANQPPALSIVGTLIDTICATSAVLPTTVGSNWLSVADNLVRFLSNEMADPGGRIRRSLLQATGRTALNGKHEKIKDDQQRMRVHLQGALEDLYGFSDGYGTALLSGKRLAIGRADLHVALDWRLFHMTPPIYIVPAETQEGDILVEEGQTSRVLVLRPLELQEAKTELDHLVALEIFHAGTMVGGDGPVWKVLRWRSGTPPQTQQFLQIGEYLGRVPHKPLREFGDNCYQSGSGSWTWEWKLDAFTILGDHPGPA